MQLDNVKQFNREISRFAKKLVPEKVKLLQKRIVLDILHRIIEKTPIDTGRAGFNWQVTIGTKASGTIDISGEGSSGAKRREISKEVMAKCRKALAKLKPFDIVYITNNVNYIVYLEGGSSKQAAHGMVAVTLEEIMQKGFK